MVMKTRHVRVHLHWGESESDRAFIVHKESNLLFTLSSDKEQRTNLPLLSLCEWTIIKFDTCANITYLLQTTYLCGSRMLSTRSAAGVTRRVVPRQRNRSQRRDSSVARSRIPSSRWSRKLIIVSLRWPLQPWQTKQKLIISYRNRVMSGPVDQKKPSSWPPSSQQVSCQRWIWGPHCM